MKRLLKISFDQALLSLTPILTWFLLSLLVDRNLINIFSLVYPLQYCYHIIRSPFSTGANISKIRDHNKDAVMSGLLIGTILSILTFGFAALHADEYISFMHMDVSIYHNFTVYAIILLGLQTVFSFILDKLYYEGKNSRANRYSFGFNLLSFSSLTGTALLTKNQTTIITVSLAIMTLYTLIILSRNVHRFRFRLNLLHCIKYDSVDLSSSIIYFFIFLFGLSSSFEFGANYTLAISFTALITDTQWDTLKAIDTASKIDLSRRNFNFVEHVKNAYKLLAILFITIATMWFTLARFYNLDLGLTLIYLSFEILSFLISPFFYLRVNFLQLEYSAPKATLIESSASGLRLVISLIPGPFNMGIAEVLSCLYTEIISRQLVNRHFRLQPSGKYRRRRHTTAKQPVRAYEYSRLRIDE